MDEAPAASEDELVGQPIPALGFSSTAGEVVQLADPALGDFLLFVYPRISRPGEPGSEEWVVIPGARGCTAESCGFRDLADDFRAHGLSVLGLSTQAATDQRDAVDRLGLSYPLLSDPGLELGRALGLGTFRFEGHDLYRRSTLVVRSGAITTARLDIRNGPSHPYELLAELSRGG